MALTEEETVQLLQDAAVNYFRNLNTTTKWINFINTVSKDTVKTFIQNILNNTAQSYDDSAVDLQAKADDLEGLIQMIGNL